ncbi:hypothetical protein CEXT_447211 [Caerostris extrusa]|uniref:Uncharacterized protein n=1 Tax=Caerostris extrusa TaxID=172846 RepID=A0AAV4XMR7_CAEEX|nr:hypothetical protein CEXT_447211 [Caerostris extrusa]
MAERDELVTSNEQNSKTMDFTRSDPRNPHFLSEEKCSKPSDARDIDVLLPFLSEGHSFFTHPEIFIEDPETRGKFGDISFSILFLGIFGKNNG